MRTRSYQLLVKENIVNIRLLKSIFSNGLCVYMKTELNFYYASKNKGFLFTTPYVSSSIFYFFSNSLSVYIRTEWNMYYASKNKGFLFTTPYVSSSFLLIITI